MYYTIDKDALWTRTFEEVSRVADEAYSEDGSSLYDGVVLTERDKNLVSRFVDDAVIALAQRAFDICKYSPETQTGEDGNISFTGRQRLNFTVLDLDEAMCPVIEEEITKYIYLYAAAGVFRSRRIAENPQYTERVNKALDNVISLLKSRRPLSEWFVDNAKTAIPAPKPRQTADASLFGGAEVSKYYTIDKEDLWKRTFEEVSRVADEAYSEDGASLYDSIVLTERDRGLVGRFVDDAVSALAKRAFDICRYSPETRVDENNEIVLTGRQRLHFMVMDFDESMWPIIEDEITKYLCLYAAAGVFRSRRISENPQFTERVDNSMNKVIYLLKSRRSLGEWYLNGGISDSSGGGSHRTSVISYNTTAYWDGKEDYVPRAGEIVVYSDRETREDGSAVPGIKVGDGETHLRDLAFVSSGADESASVQIQPDWNQDDASADDFIRNKPTIPSMEGCEETSNKVTSLSQTSTNTQYPSAKCVYDNLVKKYEKPLAGIPASDLANGVIPDVSQFITNVVNDLTNYYLKSETYTKAEVEALIGAIQQFHFEIYAILPATGEGNVLYLIGPTGSGSDRYEEYVYANGGFVKIGDTSIDLTGYVTTQDLNTALADYTTTEDLTTLLAAKQDAIVDLADIRSGAALGATAYQKPSSGIPASDLASGVIPTDLSELSDDSTHRLVTDTEKATWNGKTELFVAIQGTTTVAEIKSALDAGKTLIAKDSNNSYYIFSDYTESTVFGRTTRNAYFSRIDDTAGTLQVMQFRSVASGNTTCTITSKQVAELSGDLLQEFKVYDIKFPAQSPIPLTNPQTASLAYSINDKTLQLEIPDSGSTETKTLAFTEDIPTSLSQLSDDSTHRLVTDTEKSTWDGKYTKPSTGIPATDLASGVIPSVPVTDVTVGGTSVVSSGTAVIPAIPAAQVNSDWNASSGLAQILNKPDLSDYALATGDNSYDFAANSIRLVYEPQPGTTVNVPLTFALGRLHVSIPSGGALNTNKNVAFTDDIPSVPVQDVTVGGTSVVSNGTAVIPAIPSVPVTDVTVGGTSVVSSGTAVIPAIPTVPTISTNVVTDKNDDTKTSSPKSVYDEIHPATQSSQPAGGFLPNVIYNLGTLSGNTTFALATPADSSVANHYYWTFDTGSTAPTITWPASITGWNGGSAPTINASKHYEISVLGGIGAFMEV